MSPAWNQDISLNCYASRRAQHTLYLVVRVGNRAQTLGVDVASSTVELHE